MLETGQTRRTQGLQKLCGKYGRYTFPTLMFVLIVLILERELVISKKINFYYCSHKYRLDKVGADLALGNMAGLITFLG